MKTRTKFLAFGIAGVTLLGIAGARIQARLSAHQSPEPEETSRRASSELDSRYRSLGELVMSRGFTLGEGRVEVDLEDADVVLETVSGSTLELRVYVDTSDEDLAGSLFEDMEFRVVQTGTTVSIVARESYLDRGEWRNRSHFFVTTVIGVPRGVEIDAQTGDGDIQAGDLSWNTSLRSSDGDIIVDAFDGGELDIHTSDGDILVDRLDGRRAEIRTSDGDIVLRSVRAPIDVSSGDGDIRINLLDSSEVSVSTGDGDITVTAPADLAANVYLEGEDLSVAPGLELIGRIREHSVRGTLNGGGPSIELRTGDGSISLRRGN